MEMVPMLLLVVVCIVVGYALGNYMNRKQKAVADKLNDAATNAVRNGGKGDSEGP